MNGMVEFKKLLAVEQERLTESVLAGQNGSHISMASEVNTLKAQLKLLEARIPTTVSGRLGGSGFNQGLMYSCLWKTICRQTVSIFSTML